jgi:basic amino acid/polyamine antiporter, APA family
MSGTGKKLNFLDCMGFCIGQIIGSGIMVLTGVVIGLTGHGTPLAFIGAAILVIFTLTPSVVLASSIPATGGGYTYIKRLIGERTGFVFLGMFVLSQVLIATFAKGFASYVVVLIPSWNETAVAMGILIIAVAINLIGLKTSAIVQNLMVVFLLLALSLFIAFGLPKVDWSTLTPSIKNFMPNGIGKFLLGIGLLSFATGGAKFIAENGGEVENPKRNLPLSMIVSTLIVAVFYTLIGIVASGVLPIEAVAFKTLSDVAKVIFPAPLFVFFIIGGGMFALATTVNGTLSWVTRGMHVAATEKWLPEIFARQNKAGIPAALLIMFFIVGSIPIVTGMDIKSIAAMGIGVNMVCELMSVYACYLLPKKNPEAFASSPLGMKRTPLNILLILATVLLLGTFYISLSDLKPNVLAMIAVYVVILLAYAQLRYKFVIEKNKKNS